MTLPRLDSATVRAYLARLDHPDVSLDVSGLARLVRAHLYALPFHHLTLLAGGQRAYGYPPVEASVEGNLAGLGGAGEALTPPFVALLQTLGFDAGLAAATLANSGEHIVGVVRFPYGRFVVDIGSGLPCLHPLPLQGGPFGFTAYGCAFHFETDEVGHRLWWTRPDGQREAIYHVDPEVRTYASFQALRGRRPEFQHGPAIADLRVVRMTEWALATVRDGSYQRFAGGLSSTRPVTSWTALAELLEHVFGLPADLIDRALHALRSSRSDLLTSTAPERTPRILLSVGVTDRVEGIRGLLGSAADALTPGAREATAVGVLVLDNGRGTGGAGGLGAAIAEARQRGLRVVVVRAQEELARLAPVQQMGLLPSGLTVPLPIGATRTLQAALLHQHLRTGAFDLPHPSDGGGPVLVWMLDDDLAFRRLGEDAEGWHEVPREDVFAQVERLWRDHPGLSVALGTFTGDPPIPGYATFHVQTRDLAGNLAELGARAPEAPWEPSAAPRQLPDYYYDHARHASGHLSAVFPWRPPERGPWTVRAAFRSLCDAFAEVPHGRLVTRPLIRGREVRPEPSRNRGGNALFLDPDALVAAPYPVLCDEDRVMTRRADTLWAHLIAREPLIRMLQVDLDLMHGRSRGDRSSPLTGQQPDAIALRRFVESQERGVVLARLLERESPASRGDAEREVALRRQLLARSREGVVEALRDAREALEREDAWWWRDAEDAARARRCLGAAAEVERLSGAVDALIDPELPERLARFVNVVVAALPAWRATWA